MWILGEFHAMHTSLLYLRRIYHVLKAAMEISHQILNTKFETLVVSQDIHDCLLICYHFQFFILHYFLSKCWIGSFCVEMTVHQIMASDLGCTCCMWGPGYIVQITVRKIKRPLIQGPLIMSSVVYTWCDYICPIQFTIVYDDEKKMILIFFVTNFKNRDIFGNNFVENTKDIKYR